MIPLNQEQRLGRRTFLLLLVKRTATSFLCIVIALVLGTGKDFIATGLFGFLKNSPIATPAALESIAGFISGIALVFLLLAVILFVLGYIVSRLHYVNYTFTLEEFDLKLKKGLFNVKEVSIPYRQIQSVDVTRPLWYQLFGLSRLVMITAGHEDAGETDETDTIFDPIDSEIAEEIRMMLQRKIGVQIVEAETKADKEAGANV